MKIPDGLSEDDIYFLMAALRGPDADAEALKVLFTARLRYFVEDAFDWRLPVGAAVRENAIIPRATILQAVREAERMSPSQLRHYLGHLSSAFMALKVYYSARRSASRDAATVHEICLLRDAVNATHPARWENLLKEVIREEKEED
jgi:hypothetical protein